MKKLLLLLLLVSNYTFGQFSESFEGATIPTGWTVLAGGDAGQTWALTDLATSTGIQAQNGTKIFAIMYGATAHNDYLVTPQFTVTAGVSDKLTFWGRSRDPLYPETISVKASTTTATAAAMSTVLAASVAPASGANFVKYTIDLTALVGQSIYVGFHSTSTDMFYFDIDQVVVGGTSSCIEPVSPLVFTGISPTSVTISWLAANPIPGSGYDVYVSASGVAPTASSVPIFNTVGTTVSLTGLAANTKYYVYTRSKCSESLNSVWGHLGVLLTAPNPAVPPYTYGFDNLTGFAADGWTGNSAGTWSANATTGNPQAGAGMIFSNNSLTAATNRWVFSPPIALQANSVNTITFYIRNFTAANPSPNQSFKLTVGSSNTIAAQTTNVYNTTIFSGTAWTQFSTNYIPTVTGVYYFGFNHFSPVQSSSVSLGLDSFSITSVLDNQTFETYHIAVYPNPTSDVLHVKSSDLELINAVSVMDLNGRQIFTKTVENVSEAQVNVSDLSTGMYLINITSNGKTITRKFLKQ